MWAEYTLLLIVEPWLLLADQWEGFAQASQLQGLAVTTYHQPPPSGESAVERQSGGALKWSVAIHLLLTVWSFPGDAGQGQLQPVFCPGPPSVSYKADVCYLSCT